MGDSAQHLWALELPSVTSEHCPPNVIQRSQILLGEGSSHPHLVYLGQVCPWALKLIPAHQLQQGAGGLAGLPPEPPQGRSSLGMSWTPTSQSQGGDMAPLPIVPWAKGLLPCL